MVWVVWLRRAMVRHDRFENLRIGPWLSNQIESERLIRIEALQVPNFNLIVNKTADQHARSYNEILAWLDPAGGPALGPQIYTLGLHARNDVPPLLNTFRALRFMQCKRLWNLLYNSFRFPNITGLNMALAAAPVGFRLTSSQTCIHK